MMIQAPLDELYALSEVEVLRPSALDTDAVLEMLGRCSKASLFHRFHYLTDGADYFRTLLRAGPVEQTFLAWYRSSCVGVATLGIGSAGRADIAALIEDGWQRRGIGAQLVALLLADARAQGTNSVHADVLPEDLFILNALKRIGPLTMAVGFDGYSVEIDIGGHRDQSSSYPAGLYLRRAA